VQIFRCFYAKAVGKETKHYLAAELVYLVFFMQNQHRGTVEIVVVVDCKIRVIFVAG
jgi:hypothetical protein